MIAGARKRTAKFQFVAATQQGVANARNNAHVELNFNIIVPMNIDRLGKLGDNHFLCSKATPVVEISPASQLFELLLFCCGGSCCWAVFFCPCSHYIIFIIRLSAKGTDEVMKPAVFRTFSKFVTISTECSVYYRTRGGEWWGCIAATPHIYMVRSSVKASTIGANK